LPYVVGVSHTMPIIYVNRGPMLLNLIGWRHYLGFKLVLYIPRTTAKTPSAEPGPSSRLSCITVQVYCIAGTRTGRGASHHMGTL